VAPLDFVMVTGTLVKHHKKMILAYPAKTHTHYILIDRLVPLNFGYEPISEIRSFPKSRQAIASANQ
jgi:hypothetical protein